MAISPLNATFSITNELISMREQMFDLQRQLATGKRATTYGELGSSRLDVLALREKASVADGYLATIDRVGVRLNLVHTNLQRIHDIVAQARTDAIAPQFDLVTSDQTRLQVDAREKLNETVSLLNFELSGRHYFAGRAMDKPPVEDIDIILNGDGVKAGLKQFVAERKLADLGSDGRGRLVIPASVAGVANISEDAAGSPFGFKLAGVANLLTGTSVAGPTGSPASLDVTFSATLPVEGDTLKISLTLPDGSEDTIEFTAVTGAPTAPGEFTIGVDETATAANFQAAMVASVEARAQTSLAAASAVEAADNMFFYDDANPPQRIDGPPFDSATALKDATSSDTVFWYQGDAGPGSARDSSVAKIDSKRVVSYGTRANEEALSTAMAGLAVLAVETFSAANPNDEARFGELSKRVSDKLSYPNGKQSTEDLIGELGFKQAAIDNARSRHEVSQIAIENLLFEFEGADSFLVGTRLLQLQTQLQVSFEATSLVSRLSLVNFL